MPLPKLAVLAITAALTAGSVAMQMMQKIQGPRLKDLDATTADYGAPLNYFYGKRRMQCPIIWAEPIKEKKKKQKTKGGKYNEYTYYGTWAVAIADHEIEAVTRVWFDTRLVYDATNGGPILAAIGEVLGGLFADTGARKDSFKKYMTIYLGTETQEPDPRMVATVEAAHGPGSCPAYRGVAYIVFKDLPLEKFGNRIPQITVEAITESVTSLPYEETPTLIDCGDPFEYSPNGAYFFFNDGAEFEVWDTATRTRMVYGSWTGAVGRGQTIANDGTIYGLRSGGSPAHEFVVRHEFGSSFGTDIYETGDNYSRVLVRNSIVDDAEFLFVAPFSAGQYFAFGDSGGILTEYSTPGYQFESVFPDLDGNVWLVGAYNSGTTVIFKRMYGSYGSLPDYFEVGGMPTTQGSIAQVCAMHYRDNTLDQFVVAWDGFDYLLAIDLATQTVTDTANIGGGKVEDIENVAPGAASFWIDGTEISCANFDILRSLGTDDLFEWVVTATPTNIFYDLVNHALVGVPAFQHEMVWYFLDRVDSPGVTLGDIVADVCSRSGFDPADFDTTALDQPVKGYSWTQGTGKAIIEPLLDVWDSAARPHDFTTEFIKRGDAPAATIEVAEFLAGEPRYTVTRVQDSDLPRRISMVFADEDAEQQPGTVLVQRPLDAMDGVRETSYDLTTLVLTSDEARNLAERYFRRLWGSRERYSHGLLAKRLALEPGDVWTLGLDDIRRGAQLSKLTISADDSLKLEWMQDSIELATLTTTTGAPQDGHIDSVIMIPLQSKAIILDIPLIKDGDNDTNPSMYYGSAPFGTDGIWGGAVIYQSDGADYSIEFASVPASLPDTWGYSTTTLATASCNVWDRGNTVTVLLNVGDLTSVTEAECNLNPLLNMALLGNELIQFATATLNGDGSYTLSDLKRGRRGTEWAASGHTSNDTFYLMDAVGNTEMGASDIGDTLSFKAVSTGRTIESAIPSTVIYAGNTHKPYAPVHLRATKATDATISWRRRSRIGSRWTGLTTVPLGEDTESYEIDIYSGVTFKRTLTSASQSVTYTAADMTTDGTGSGFTANVYQISALVDRGNEASATFAF